jgi:hypothetical protein
MMTRELWLEKAIDYLRPYFKEAGCELPQLIHISVGFGASARAESKKVMGVTWSGFASADGNPHIFISPTLADTFEVIETVAHELIHAWDNNVSGHRGAFAEKALALGFTAPFSYTPSGPALQATLISMAAALGDYPHSALDVDIAKMPVTVAAGTMAGGAVSATTIHFSSGPSTQSTRLVKCLCPECGYIVRTTKKWLDRGAPICPTDMISMLF